MIKPKPQMPGAVAHWLEMSRTNRQPIRIFYGDADGRAWPEENDVWGIVGRSTGTNKIALLVHPNAHGGPAILYDCIVGIVTAGSDGKARFVYRHPSLDLGDWSTVKADGFWYTTHNGKTHARHDTEVKADRYLKFMTGQRVSK